MIGKKVSHACRFSTSKSFFKNSLLELKRAQKGYWKNKYNHRKFLDWLGQELHFTCKEDWYKVKASTILKHGGKQLLYKYGGSPSKLVQSVYSDQEWFIWKFGRVPKGYVERFSSDKVECLRIAQDLTKQLQIKELEEWYRVSCEQIGRIIRGYNVSKILPMVYPEHSWENKMFSKVTFRSQTSVYQKKRNQFRNREENLQEFMDWLGSQLGFKAKEDWYGISARKIVKHGGGRPLYKFGGSPSKLVQTVYPQHYWLIWNFERIPKGFWQNTDNQRIFMNHLAQQLGLYTKEDWYLVHEKDIIRYGGGPLLAQYGNSALKLLQTFCPKI